MTDLESELRARIDRTAEIQARLVTDRSSAYGRLTGRCTLTIDDGFWMLAEIARLRAAALAIVRGER